MKNQIIAELNTFAECGIRKTAKIIDRIRAGEFDDTINELEGISVTDAADLICDLA